MKRIIGILLIVTGIIIGIMGIRKMDQSHHDASIGPIKVEATDSNGISTGIVWLVGGSLATAGGIALILVGRRIG